MTDLETHLQIPGSFTAHPTAVRALLRRRRIYVDAVKKFEPNRETQKIDISARDALRRIAERAPQLWAPAFLFVNNRLDGDEPSNLANGCSASVDRACESRDGFKEVGHARTREQCCRRLCLNGRGHLPGAWNHGVAHSIGQMPWARRSLSFSTRGIGPSSPARSSSANRL
jgi:hypothetical protein